MESSQLTTEAMPACILCGQSGRVLYKRLDDRMCGVPGSWRLVRCQNDECGLVWQDPMIVEEDLAKAYREYFTHEADSETPAGPSLVWRMAELVKRLVPAGRVARDRRRLELAYLDERPKGSVLDVGCGDGTRAAQLRDCGWEVRCQEVDPAAADHARKKFGLDVHVGTIAELAQQGAAFDAVISNHVLEHVRDPLDFVRTCCRMVKPGGTFVAATPNMGSHGHGRYGKYWMGLDQPRHLFLFSPHNAASLAQAAGFENHRVWTTPARAAAFSRVSQDFRHGFLPGGLGQPCLSRGVRARLFQLRASWAYRSDQNSGEELILQITP